MAERDEDQLPVAFEERARTARESLAGGQFDPQGVNAQGVGGTFAPAPAPAPTTPALPQQSDILTQFQEYQKGRPEAIEELETKRKEAERLGMQPFPKLPAAPRLRDIPRPPQDQYQNVFKQASPALIFLTAMGSLMSRQSGMGAMAAATGFMEGFQEGDKLKIERNRQLWQDNVDALTRQNQIETERYRAALDKPEWTLRERQAQIAALSSSFGDKIKIEANKKGDMELLDRMVRDQALAAYRLRYSGAIGQMGSENFESTAKLIAEYKISPPSLSTNIMRNPAALASFEQLMNRVKELNPNFRADTFRNQQLGQTRFTSGPQGNQIRRFNVVMNHLDVLENLADALQNGDTVRFNQLSQFLAAETGKPAPTNFDAARNLVGTEVTQAVGGSQMTGPERAASADAFQRMRGPAAAKGAIGVVKSLIAGQLGGMRHQYMTSTGRSEEDFNQLLFPETVIELSKYAQRPKVSGPSGAGQKAEPVQVQTPAEAEKLAPGTLYVTPDGKQYTR